MHQTTDQSAVIPVGLLSHCRNGLCHPLAIGAKLMSIAGEWDEDDDGSQRDTGANAIGRIVSAQYYIGQGWSYGVVFNPSGVWVHIDEADGLDDPLKYQVAQ
jgi:hypothetical protein